MGYYLTMQIFSDHSLREAERYKAAGSSILRNLL